MSHECLNLAALQPPVRVIPVTVEAACVADLRHAASFAVLASSGVWVVGHSHRTQRDDAHVSVSSPVLVERRRSRVYL